MQDANRIFFCFWKLCGVHGVGEVVITLTKYGACNRLLFTEIMGFLGGGLGRYEPSLSPDWPNCSADVGTTLAETKTWPRHQGFEIYIKIQCSPVALVLRDGNTTGNIVFSELEELVQKHGLSLEIPTWFSQVALLLWLAGTRDW